jgi:hypothetical protein
MTHAIALEERPRFGTVSVGIKCPRCGKGMHFIRTENGKQMPCEMELKKGDGKMTLITHQGKTIRKASDHVYGYEPHFGYCRTGGAR